MQGDRKDKEKGRERVRGRKIERVKESCLV